VASSPLPLVPPSSSMNSPSSSSPAQSDDDNCRRQQLTTFGAAHDAPLWFRPYWATVLFLIVPNLFCSTRC
jgi:hypothetical protein